MVGVSQLTPPLNDLLCLHGIKAAGLPSTRRVCPPPTQRLSVIIGPRALRCLFRGNDFHSAALSESVAHLIWAWPRMRLAGFLCLCDRLSPIVAFAVQAVDVVLGGKSVGLLVGLLTLTFGLALKNELLFLWGLYIGVW